MGSVAVLNPRGCLQESLSPTQMKKPLNAYPNRVNRTQYNRRKRSPTRPSSSPAPSRPVAQKAPSTNLIMGQVKILKRGENLSQADKEILKEVDLVSTERLGPDPVSIPNRIRLTTDSNVVAGFYAGASVFAESPPPSSLPLPAFFLKKCVPVKNEDVASDLRRILRLD
ncbi:hypothetical protein I3843_07G222300 [Carya illinoinensis]|uniref:Uncharacterized protein n=1 Tax=Carya illinoinensis TaxID=32201 RepID=A0A8T1Q5F5_CARIL|nr:uncharacterized protein LOC122316432 [Carya illinoinensis]KAG2700261.1 hypothetical protein I3760_07G223000 [Carya illinoinensis]KAG6649671.1 hypothetical protein CIPAW_07G227300 [Carya illinoinensis]KAG6706596.1 hypothetical protein I3842_07G228900 [Carya illinoinensis]KAG7973334.1 hypothetical protein I3843_07G222300 [Carya illinoinensis]